jgi:hypothetical protein
MLGFVPDPVGEIFLNNSGDRPFSVLTIAKEAKDRLTIMEISIEGD